MSDADRLTIREFLTGVWEVFMREMAGYFDSNIAYVYTIAFTLLANSQFMDDFFLTGTVEMASFFHRLPFLLVFFLPAITMRLWAEEKKTRTVELLLTLPILPVQAVLGKYLAALGLFLAFLVGTLPIPVMLMVLGSPDLGTIISGYLGLTLLAGLFLTLGMFFSALSADQIVAFVLSAVAGLILVLTGDDRVVAILDGLSPALSIGTLLYENLSVIPPYETMVRGLIGLEQLAYFVLLSLLFIWLNVRVLERDRT
jgi:ABC-2 type transport system permease protein